MSAAGSSPFVEKESTPALAAVRDGNKAASGDLTHGAVLAAGEHPHSGNGSLAVVATASGASLDAFEDDDPMSTSPTERAEHKKTLSKINWRLLPLLCLMYLAAFLD